MESEPPADDMMSEIIGRVPKSRLFVIGRVSEQFHDITTSMELLKVRDRLGRDGLWVTFKDGSELVEYKVVREDGSRSHTVSVFTITKPPVKIQFATSSRGFIYMVCASLPSSPTRIWFYDLGKFVCTEAPAMPQEVNFTGAARVENEIVVFGKTRETREPVTCIQRYNIDTNQWKRECLYQNGNLNSSMNLAVRKKVYMVAGSPPMWFDAGDGSYGPLELHSPSLCDACVMSDRLFAFYVGIGLMSYNGNTWKEVSGISKLTSTLTKLFLAELNGKIAVLWISKEEEDGMRKLMMTRISVDVSEEGDVVKGSEEEVETLALIPSTYEIARCVAIFD